MTNQARKVVAVVSDLMFTVKIQDAAKRAGLGVVFVKSAEQAIEQADESTAVVILDLNNTAGDALDIIGRLKSDVRTSSVSLLGYVSHVQTDLIKAAQARGCDAVMARSAFSHNLPAILRRYGEAVTHSRPDREPAG